MVFVSFMSHPLVRLAAGTALLAIALGVTGALGAAMPAFAALALGAGACAMRIISAPLALALARTCDTALPPPQLRDPVFYLVGLTVFAMVATWAGMFFLFGRATSAMAYISFTLAR